MKESLKLKKRQLLRNNEYYSIQDTFDTLYSKASKNYKFTDLMQSIVSEQNILLAYRNIKKNKGSTTVGTDNLDIKFFEKHSYGFRPNRSTNHAIARCMHLVNKNNLHYVVDIDIKGFF